MWVPFKVSFEYHESNFQFYLDLIVDILFLTDVVVNFFKAYVDDTSKIYVVNRCKIVKRYIKTWFCLDFFSSLPF